VHSPGSKRKCALSPPTARTFVGHSLSQPGTLTNVGFSSDPVVRFGEIASGFTSRVEGVSDWEAPAPVEGWVARDVVDHLITWIRGFLSGGGVDLPPLPDDSPERAWSEHVGQLKALLDASGADHFAHPQAGAGSLADVLDQFYSSDVFMHTWDLARATGQDETLDAEYSALLLEGMRPIEQLLRNSGHYGPAMPVADDAPPHEQLMAFIGRRVQ
jgi:uncharacterized protein (TIGR03086 family)